MKDGKQRLWHRAKDLTGRQFGYLTILRYSRSLNGKTRWIAQCDCGTKIEVEGAGLTRARGPSPKSCGCKTGELIIAKRRSHGLSYHPIHAVWDSMVQRCTNSRHAAWKNYGGRGISVCKRWMKFENFVHDMLPAYRQGLTLERRNNSRGYSPGNCYWATRTEQARNTRVNRTIDTPNGQMLIVEASELSGIRQDTLRWRVVNGWPTKQLFLKPDLANKYSTSRMSVRVQDSPS